MFTAVEQDSLRIRSFVELRVFRTSDIYKIYNPPKGDLDM